MAPVGPTEFLVIGMVGNHPERFLEAVPADATMVCIVTRDANDTCAAQAEEARKSLAARDPPIKLLPPKTCQIYNVLSAFALVDELLRTYAGARIRIVVGTGTTVFGIGAYQAALAFGAEVVNITEDGGERRIRTDPIEHIPPEPEDDLLVALRVVEAQRDGRITGRKLQGALKRLGRPTADPVDDEEEGGRPKARGGRERQIEDQRAGVRAQRFVVRLEQGGYLDTPPPARGQIPFSYIERTYELSDTAKRIVAGGHSSP